MKKKAYLISQDLWILFSSWAKEAKFNLPSKSYFDGISKGIVKDLQSIFCKCQSSVDVALISYDDLSCGMAGKLLAITNSKIIALDKAYPKGDFQLEINRTVRRINGEWKDAGEHSRPGFISVEWQLDQISSKINGSLVAITDDGCWSGGSISRVINELQKREVGVSKVIVGIFVDGGEVLPSIPLEYVYRYDANQIVDWICERDFLPGAPYGGRTVIPDSRGEVCGNFGAYYLLKMGDYANWASLGFEESLISEFTLGCVMRSVGLFETIERLSGRIVSMSDLSRLPYGIKFDFHERFVDVLKRQFDLLDKTSYSC